MTELTDYQRGRYDVIDEIFAAAGEGKTINEKMDKLLDETLRVLRKMNNIHVTGVPRK